MGTWNVVCGSWPWGGDSGALSKIVFENAT